MPELSLVVPREIISAAKRLKARRSVEETLRRWLELGYKGSIKAPTLKVHKVKYRRPKKPKRKPLKRYT